jgi:methylthioribose-1-phosphate isomerase
MRVAGKEMRTIWPSPDRRAVLAIDQRALPGRLEIARLEGVEAVAHAIRDMLVRGAPLIGVAAAYGLALAAARDPSDAALDAARALLGATRPTAVNLRWALDRVGAALANVPPVRRAEAAFAEADAIAEDDVRMCRQIGEHALPLLRARKGEGPLRVMTHCNAGWLATVDWGTALAPVYLLHRAGVEVHVWVSETRPRNQGHLTAWELAGEGVPHTLIVDNAAGHLIARGEVDAVIVGSDRTTAAGDVANKVGTYLKALAARAHGVPFYVALPSSSIDFRVTRGAEIPIEQRDGREVGAGVGVAVQNPAFDVTPAHLVSALITERGVCAASAEGLAALFGRAA